MKTSVKSGILLSGIALALVAGCTSGGDVIRGEGVDKGKLDSFQCTEDALKSKSSPFLVSWPEAAREDIELAMKEGIVVVKYSCDGVEVLDACEVPGSYTYQGMETKKKVKSMKDSGEAAATFGGSFAIPGKVESSMKQGRALNLAYAIVGARSTTVKRVTADMLAGPECAGATHFVYRTKVGAFAMDTSEEGQVSAAAAAFGYGSASGTASSSQSELTQEGSVDSCKEASPDDTSSVSGCGSPLRVSLRPILPAAKAGDKKAAPVADAEEDDKGCPEGFVYADDGCVRPRADVVPLCSWDAAECKSNCEKGSSASCGRLGDVLLTKYWEDFGGGITGDKIAIVQPLLKGMNDKLKAACDDDGEGAACTLYAFNQAFTASSAAGSTFYGPNGDAKSTVPTFVKYAERGCGLADSMGCVAMATAYTDGYFADKEEYGEFAIGRNDEKAERLLEGACARGAARSCALLVARNNTSRDPGVFKGKVLTNLEKACNGGVETACFVLGALYLPQDECTALMTNNEVDVRMDKDPVMSSEFTMVPDPTDPEQVKLATEWVAQRGCGKTPNPSKSALLFQQACDGDFDLDSNIMCDTAKKFAK